jgi:hypothetical protein
VMQATRHIDQSVQRHICFVTETYPPEINGVALTLARLVKGLSAGGHEVSIVRPYQQGCDSSCNSTVTLVPGLPLPGQDTRDSSLDCRRSAAEAALDQAAARYSVRRDGGAPRMVCSARSEAPGYRST